MSHANRRLVFAGILSGLMLSAIEITVVGTAAPKIARDIGGLDSYSWIFTIYLLTATLSMPLWGRMADQIGRKKLFIASMVVFLLGSVLCGCARSMTELIVFRGIKGFGSGGLFPLAFTIVADIYPFGERSKVQGYLSSVWGLASIIGPFIGGGLTDLFGWRSIFFINLIPGVASIFLIARHFHETYAAKRSLALSLGSLTASSAAVSFLLGAMSLWQHGFVSAGWGLFSLAAVTSIAFVHLERRVPYPLIPPSLLKNRIFVMSGLTGFFSSMMVIGLSSFGPLLFQSVMGFTPTESGLLLVPFTIAWVVGSIVSTRLLLAHHYRKLLIAGTVMTFFGFLSWMILYNRLNTALISLTLTVAGFGMAFNYPVALITTQTSVAPDQVAFATSGIAWIRNLGTTVGTTFMGLALSAAFQRGFVAQAKNLGVSALERLRREPQAFFQPGAAANLAPGLDVTSILRDALFWVFAIQFAAVTAAMVLSYFFPKSPMRSAYVEAIDGVA